MDIAASILDQQLLGIPQETKDEVCQILNINPNDTDKLKSALFTFICIKDILDLDEETALDCLVDGGGDFGTDAVYIDEENDGEFSVVLIQSKYAKSLDGNKNFPQTGIEKLIKAVQYLFNPAADLGGINMRLKAKVEDIRSRIRDGQIPQIRVIACNNGLKWNREAQTDIDREFQSVSQVSWEYANHETLLAIRSRTKPVDAVLRLKGKAVIEDMNFSRVCIGRIPVKEIAQLMRQHGEKLLERNIRRYLGLTGNRVNQDIQRTLQHEPDNFYFYNNGLTLICRSFSYNALQTSDYQVNVTDLQIVNGGQTSMTLMNAIADFSDISDNASVLVRIYELPKEQNDLVMKITHATNSQNPVDLKDLRANDPQQQRLEISIAELGYTYRRKRSQEAGKNDITSGTVAEAVLSVVKEKPQQAKFFTKEHFGKLYGEIFDNLNGAQAVLSVLIYRMAENRRKRPQENDPDFVRYASCFIAMQIGRKLLADLGLASFDLVNHQNFVSLQVRLDEKGEAYLQAAIQDIRQALAALYNDSSEISLQQLAATFRRGDLINYLK